MYSSEVERTLDISGKGLVESRPTMGGTNQNTYRRYGFAIIAVTLAVLLRLLLDPVLHERLPFATLLVAVMSVAYFGGRGPAILVLLLGSAAVTYFILEPRYSFRIEKPEYIIGLAFYAMIGGGNILLLEQLRTAWQRAEANASDARLKNQRLLQETQSRREMESAVINEGERLRVTLASIADGVITTDGDGRVTFINLVAQEMTGWTSAEAQGVSLETVFQIVNETTRQPVENPALRSLREGHIVGLANHTLLISRDGTERPINDSAAPIRDQHGNIFGSVLVFQDITDQKRAEQRRNARLAVTQILSEAARADEAIAGVLQAICECLDWDAGLYWVVNSNGTALHSSKCWHRPNESMNAFEAANASITFGKAHGLPGRAWESSQPAWIPDITQDRNFPRLDSAVSCGLRSAFACPIIVNDQTLGVIEFFSRHHRDADADLLEVMGTVASSVGQFIVRNTAQQELWQREEMLTDFFENATVGLHWVGPDGIILRANQAELDMLGYSREEYVGHHIADFHADEVVIRDILNRLQAGQKVVDCPARLKCRDGTIKDVLIDSSVWWKDGKFAHTRCFTRDVTERKRSEQTARFLADASASLAALVDFYSTLQKVASLAVPYFADWAAVDLAEADGSLRRVAVAHVDPAKVELAHEVHRRFPPDPAAAQGVHNILRTGQAEIVRQITDEMLVEAVQNEELLRILRVLGLKSYIGVPLQVRGKTLGALTFISAESGHLYDETDLAIAQDLAARAAIAIENAQLYQELQDADRRKDDFLAMLAHELRNPLAPIRNGLQVLRLSGPEDGIAAEALSMMERQLGQLVRLVDDLLDVSRITRDKLELRKQRVELATVIANAIETSRPLIEQAGHSFSVTLPPDPVVLEADSVRLAQVFSNLLNNSAKYTEPGGRIALSAERVGREVLVRVRDNGSGISADALPRIFEMFSQVDRNLGQSQGGLGIGLTLVRRLVEMHGGSVEVRSDGAGRGSEFTVRLPVLDVDLLAEENRNPDADATTATPVRRVLVVDDNRDSATSLAMMLRIMGNETRIAYDGLAAVKAAEEFRPDIILLDIGLPKMNGYDACRRIREQPWSRGMVIVALTGWGQDEDRRRSAEAGFDRHLVKPPEPKVLETLIAELKGAAE